MILKKLETTMRGKHARSGATLVALASLALTGPALAGALSPNFMGPSKDVALRCAPLPYLIHCTISRMANPEYKTYCFNVAGGRSTPMRTDYRFGFYDRALHVKVHNGVRITAALTELRTGRRAICQEVGAGY
jgi:hypothetical protein